MQPIYCLSAVLLATVSAFDVDPSSKTSLIAGASIAANNLIKYYDGYRSGGIIGMYQSPVYWWEAGAAWNAYLDFWRYTGNTTFNEVTKTSLLWQVGQGKDYLPANFSTSEGNDDQAFWAMAAMSAAEYNFSNPDPSQPQWLALAQAVFNQQASRWDTQYCGGGLRWQVFQFNNGYNYKNSISNAGLFNLAARLARYTGNQTYANWAEIVWDWQLKSGFMNSSTYAIYDGAQVPTCAAINNIQWTYNNALFMAGAAYMWNHTDGNQTWGDRIDKLIVRTKTDFVGGANLNIIYEPACEPYDTCNVDQHSFKGYLARSMGYTMLLYPKSRSTLAPILANSAIAAGKACTGTVNGNTQQCGFKWTWNNGTFDGSTAVGFQVGQNMAVMETIQANLAVYMGGPLTNTTGGSSVGDVTAGNTQSSENANAIVIAPPTTADKAGAGILTAIATAGSFVFAWWIAL